MVLSKKIPISISLIQGAGFWRVWRCVFVDARQPELQQGFLTMQRSLAGNGARSIPFNHVRTEGRTFAARYKIRKFSQYSWSRCLAQGLHSQIATALMRMLCCLQALKTRRPSPRTQSPALAGVRPVRCPTQGLFRPSGCCPQSWVNASGLGLGSNQSAEH